MIKPAFVDRLSRLRSQLHSADLQPQHQPGMPALQVPSSGSLGSAKTVESVCPEMIYDPEMLAAFDAEQFRRDGFVCFPGIMTEACRKQWSASLRRLQEIQDFMIWNTDWDNMDWSAQRDLDGQPLSGTGTPTPENPITTKQKRTWAGTSEATYRAFPGGYGRGLHCNLPLATPAGVENHGFLPEHFPLAYDPFLMEVATQHPQMLALQHALHGDAGPLRVDHTILLNRKAGATGRTWHSHLYGPGDTQDNDITENTGLFLVRTLCFPDGVTPGKADRPAVPEDANTPEISAGGLVGMIPGAHHFKDPWPGPRLWTAGPPDTGMRENWMADKINPLTGKPLEIVYPALPPGSLLCFVHWMPHGVTYVESGVRWGVLLTYRTMDPSRRIRAAPQIPWDWVDRHRGELTQQQWELLADTPEHGWTYKV